MKNLLRTLNGLIALSFSSLAFAGDVFVDPGGGGDYLTIQAAVNGSVDGDLILVSSGTYNESVTIDGRSLWVVALNSGVVTIQGALDIRNVALAQDVVVLGLTVAPASELFEVTQVPAVKLENNAGDIRLQDCQFIGAEGGAGIGGTGGEFTSSLRVAISVCTFRGGDGGGGQDFLGFECVAWDGGAGGTLHLSSVAAWDSSFTGGDGKDCWFSAGASDGGPGFVSPNFGVFAAGSVFQGGTGGANQDVIPWDPGDGGDGLVIESASQGQLVSNTYAGGPGGFGMPGQSGVAGQATNGGGLFNYWASDARLASTDVFVPDGSSHPVHVEGTPGDTAHLMFSGRSHYAWRPMRIGFWLVPILTPISTVPIGVIPGSGVLDATVDMPLLPGSFSRLRLFGQLFISGSSGERLFGSPVHLILINCDVSGIGCGGS